MEVKGSDNNDTHFVFAFGFFKLRLSASDSSLWYVARKTVFSPFFAPFIILQKMLRAKLAGSSSRTFVNLLRTFAVTCLTSSFNSSLADLNMFSAAVGGFHIIREISFRVASSERNLFSSGKQLNSSSIGSKSLWAMAYCVINQRTTIVTDTCVFATKVFSVVS